ncbi:hypothetical protein [Massilia sp. DD77]|uniref:hypothetical protein n=1 Tax=Massilia sp. DD77 TaxID=3109349 RepID=UPI002FFE6350
MLFTEEFPFVQCAEEFFSSYGDCFSEEGALVAWTDYGEEFRFYPESNFLNLKRHLEQGGHTLEAADPDQVRFRTRATSSMRGKPEVDEPACIDSAAESAAPASASGAPD